MKVIHMPTSVGGMSWELAQGEKEIGIDSKVFYAKQNWLNYACDYCMETNLRNRFFEKIKWSRFFAKNFDVIHMNAGTSLIDYPQYNLDFLDLLLYKKNKLFMTYNGCDARQKYKRISQTNISACHFNDCYAGLCLNGNKDKERERRIRKLAGRGIKMFAVNPDLLNFLPEGATFLPYAINIGSLPRREKYAIGKRLKIVHAPTERGAKGTEDIIATIEQIKRKYPNSIEFRLVEGVPHKDALKMYKEADLIIDQIRIGWYGGLAMETMCMGIPTIAYINEEDLHFIPSQMAKDCRETVISAIADTLFETLENLINNPEILYQKHEASMEYVRRWHVAEYVASITKNYYESEV